MFKKRQGQALSLRQGLELSIQVADLHASETIFTKDPTFKAEIYELIPFELIVNSFQLTTKHEGNGREAHAILEIITYLLFFKRNGKPVKKVYAPEVVEIDLNNENIDPTRASFGYLIAPEDTQTLQVVARAQLLPADRKKLSQCLFLGIQHFHFPIRKVQ